MTHTYGVPFVKENFPGTYNWYYYVPFLIGETEARKHTVCRKDTVSQCQSQLWNPRNLSHIPSCSTTELGDVGYGKFSSFCCCFKWKKNLSLLNMSRGSRFTKLSAVRGVWSDLCAGVVLREPAKASGRVPPAPAAKVREQACPSRQKPRPWGHRPPATPAPKLPRNSGPPRSLGVWRRHVSSLSIARWHLWFLGYRTSGTPTVSGLP